MDNHAQVIIYLLVGAFWALNAWWKKYQDKQAEEASRRNPSPPASAPARPVATPESQRYQEVQAEIRRKIAERAQMPAAGRVNLPPARPVVVSAPARPMTTPVQRRPMPVAAVVEPMTYQPPSPLVMSAAPVVAAAYGSMPPDTSRVFTTQIQAALADPAAARQAFIFREIFDRPLCMRSPAGGGHDGWA